MRVRETAEVHTEELKSCSLNFATYQIVLQRIVCLPTPEEATPAIVLKSVRSLPSVEECEQNRTPHGHWQTKTAFEKPKDSVNNRLRTRRIKPNGATT